MLPRSGVAPLSLSRVGQRLGRCTCKDAHRSDRQGLGLESSIDASYWFLLGHSEITVVEELVIATLFKYEGARILFVLAPASRCSKNLCFISSWLPLYH